MIPVPNLYSIAVASLLLAACLGGDPIVDSPQDNPPTENPDETTVADLLGATWVLISVERPGEAPVAVEGDDYTVRFDTSGGVGGRIACNSWGGGYTASDSTVWGDGNFLTTLVGCADPHGADLLGSFGEDPSVYQIRNDTLCLTRDGTRTCFVKEAPPVACTDSPLCRLENPADSSLLTIEQKEPALKILELNRDSAAFGLMILTLADLQKDTVRLALSQDLHLTIDSGSFLVLAILPADGLAHIRWNGIVTGAHQGVISFYIVGDEIRDGYAEIDGRSFALIPLGGGAVLVQEISVIWMRECPAVAKPAAGQLTCAHHLP